MPRLMQEMREAGTRLREEAGEARLMAHMDSCTVTWSMTQGSVRPVYTRGGRKPARMTNTVFSSSGRMILSTNLCRMMRLSRSRNMKEAR